MGLLDLPANPGLRYPALPAATYFLTSSPSAVGTSATLGVGNLRVAPFVMNRTVALARLGAEVTTVGDAGSKVRIALYADSGSCTPGALLVDAGQIAGDSATTQELTVSATLPPGVYWVGGAVQSVTTTQPTLRVASNWHPPFPIPNGTTLPSAGTTQVGFIMSGVTAAAPSQFTSTLSASFSAVRVFARTA